MRRFVRDRISNALEQARPMLEKFIGRHLEYPFGFPYNLAPAAVLIREVRTFKVAALAKADLPPVRVEALLKTWLAHLAVELRGEWDPGVLDADVELTVQGTVTADGTYNIGPTSALLKAWWRDAAPVASQWVPRR